MKTVLISIALCTASLVASGQHLEEWTSQKKTQKKYLLQQIAALQLHLQHLKAGYKLVGTGITTIHDIKDGEFILHRNYFNSLKEVHPAVKNSPKIAEIEKYQGAIAALVTTLMREAQSEHLLNYSEKERIKNVINHLRDECEKDMEELTLVITPGVAEMTDDQRIQRLEKIVRSLQDKHSFLKAFNQKVRMTILYRRQTLEEINTVKQIYGIK